MAQRPVKELICRAVEKNKIPGTTPLEFYGELKQNLGRRALGLFVAYENGRPLAVAVAWLPVTQSMMAPQLNLVYSELRTLTRPLFKRVKSWIMEAGYDRMICINRLHTDAVVCRRFRPIGEAKVIASLVEVQFPRPQMPRQAQNPIPSPGRARP